MFGKASVHVIKVKKILILEKRRKTAAQSEVGQESWRQYSNFHYFVAWPGSSLLDVGAS